jgi:hypothetical protein
MIPEELRQYSALVVAVVSLNHRVNGAVEQLKADMQLIDGSRLQVNEVYVGGQLRKYAYYRLTPTGEVLQGWDNAPHHPEITSYPHHVHQQDGVHPSQARSLSDVFDLIAKLLQD